MTHYVWMVWKDCRLAGYIKAYSEREALAKSKEKFGERLFIERMLLYPDQEPSKCGAGKN